MINNNHRSTVIMEPKKGLTEEKEKQLEVKLKSLKDSMTDEEIEALIIKTKELKNYQETPSTPENLRQYLYWKLKTLMKVQDHLFTRKKSCLSLRQYIMNYLLMVLDIWM